MPNEKQFAQSLLGTAGVTINGSDPSDPQIHNENFYARALQQGSLGLGESYMDGWWDCEKIDGLTNKVLRVNLSNMVKNDWRMVLKLAWKFFLNSGRRSKAFEVGQKHYDIGNDLYRAMLDKRMAYSCGYWRNAKTLDEAQEAKLDLICKKLGLKPGQKILDIGSGWGSFIGYAAEKYGVKAVGVTVSKEQKKLADEKYKGLSVETRLQDYRELNEKFDHIISIGMFEHVGVRNYKDYMKVVSRCLKDDGLFLLHTIGANISGTVGDAWSDKYIFPNGKLPSAKQITEAIEGLFILEDWHNFSADYDKTLMEWHKNFEKSWDVLKADYDERFYRMWRYYLLACAGLFRSRTTQLWQIVLSKKGVLGGYHRVS